MRAYSYSILASGLLACNVKADSRIDTLTAKVDSIQRAGNYLTFLGSYNDPNTSYTMSDVDRESKMVGTFVTATPIGRGDRIFLGDDMWDVKFIKVYGAQVDSAKTTKIKSIELLVSYVGKAKDPKPVP